MAQDRYRYFRIEARELLDALSRGLLDLERSPADRSLVARLLRHAHTLKGAARVVQQTAIGDLAHLAEDALGGHREDGAPPVPRERVDELLRILDDVAVRVADLEPPPATAVRAAAEAEEPEPVQAVRVDLREVDGVLDAALEAGTQVVGLRRQVGDLDHGRELVRALSDQLSLRRDSDPAARRQRALVDELGRTLESTRRALEVRADHAAREIEQVRGAADRLRLLPARGIFGSLARAARDAARALEREIAFEEVGGEIRVEANVLSAVSQALLHAVRNAVAHGIEPPAERSRLGKPAAGRVRVEVERRGRRVAFRCRDDGRGLDRPGIAAAALRRGLVSEEEARGLDADGFSRLLLRGGISTSSEVTAVSGRGVGLDVVRDVAKRIGADVAIHGEPGRGTALELVVAASLTAMPALHVEAGGAVVAVPLEAVRHVAFVPPRSLVRSGEGSALAHDGALVPFVPLEQILRRPSGRDPRRAWSAVLVESDGVVVAVGADRLVGTGDVVVRGVPAFTEVEAAVAGAALDAEGNPRLVLDPAGLVASAQAVRAPPEERRPRAAAPMLVVDDSLTTRMLEQSILESAGYEVDLAVSGEEALAKARARKYALFIVDVEMPGMDGFELVRATRADPRLAGTPAILVTSRGAPEDRQRGLDAGASAYIVKSEFDQVRLLAIIEELLT